MLRTAAAFAFVFSISLTAHAGDRFELGAYGGYLFGGSVDGEGPGVRATASIESAPSYGGFVDVKVRPGAFAELSYSRSQTELSLRRSDGFSYQYDLLLQYFQIGGLMEYQVPRAEWFRPTFGGTIGATVFTSNDGVASYEEWRLSLLLEIGAKIRLTDFLGLRARVRGFGTFLTDEAAIFCLGGACAVAATGTALLQGEVGGGAYLSF
jgi:hypothetical protein